MKPKRNKDNPNDSWVAPEHYRFSRGMRRDYDRDEEGKPIKHRGRNLVVDPRPTIMTPEKPKTYFGFPDKIISRHNDE